MKHLYLLVSLIAVVSCPQFAHSAIRCDRDLISDGDTTLEVTIKLQKCGEILGKEVIRSENSVGRKREEWLVRVYESYHYYCYLLKFRDGKLHSIEYLRRCD
jgi:hypothetical protein